MRNSINRIGAIMLLLPLMALALMLNGCGGSGGGISTQVVSGNASAGAPLTGQVSLKDSSSPVQQKTATIGSDGSFAFDVTGLKAPFILQAAGAGYKLHSFAAGTGIANINPLSNVLVASAAGVTAPEQLFTNPDPAVLQQVQAGLPAAAGELMSQLRPLLRLYGAEGRDPIKDPYQADHKGLDGMFDNVAIAIPNGVITVANIASNAVIFSAPLNAINSGRFTSDPAALPQPAPVPAAPAGVSAAGGVGQATIVWSGVGNATAYNLYYATTPGVTPTSGTRIANVTTPYLHTGLTADSTYYYVVTAVNGAGESAPSAEASARVGAAVPEVPLPAAPSGVIAAGGTKQTTITWGAVAGASSYNLYYASTSGVTPSNGTKLANVTSPAVHSGLASGTTYYYIVTAVNAAGEGASSVQVAASTLAAAPTPVVPSIPQGITATGSARQVTLSWPAVAGASSYNVYWSTSAGLTTATGTRVAGVTAPYVLTGLADATTYYLIVTAVNSAGESLGSTRVSAVTDPPVTRQLGLAWDPVAGATSYNLYWSTTPGVTPATGRRISVSGTTYLHAGLTAGTTYYYVVTATDGSVESSPSAPVSGTTAR